MKMEQILRLGHSAARYGTRGDVRRAWAMLAPESAMLMTNKVSPHMWRKFVERIGGDGRYFKKLKSSGWDGAFFEGWKYPYRWSRASQLAITPEDWEAAWPELLRQMDAGELKSLKTGRSGDVWEGTVTLGGQRVEVIVKQPRRKRWWRYINEMGRGSKAWRAWKKGWSLIARNIPNAWPLLIMEKRRLGYVTDQVIICEKVQGPTLAKIELEALPTADRDEMFRRCGRILRRIEETGLCHFDSKSSNWIIAPDEERGPTPILVDVDGIRFYRWDTFGLHRLLRSMKDHAQYVAEDSLSICQGYARMTRMETEEDEA